MNSVRVDDEGNEGHKGAVLKRDKERQRGRLTLTVIALILPLAFSCFCELPVLLAGAQ